MVKDPAQRMALGEVRRRLRPLIGDPDDPLYPGSPDAPTMAATYRVTPSRNRGSRDPAARGPRDGARRRASRRRPAASRWCRRPLPGPGPAPPVPATPLASSPGPLPEGLRFEPAPVEAGPSPRDPPSPDDVETEIRPVPRPASGLSAVGLVAAGAAVVLAGLAGGWVVTRAVAGQSPLTTVTVATEDTALRAHTDELGFTAQVPQDWTERRAAGAVSFLSPDGSEELTVSRAGSADEVAGGITPESLGTSEVQVDPRRPVPGTDATQLVFRTVDGGLPRTGWVRVLPARDGVLAVRLEAPGGNSESVSERLFDAVASQVAPTGGLTAGKRRRRPAGRRCHRRSATGTARRPRMTDAAAAAAALAHATGVAAHDVAVVLGSGWRPAADLIGEPAHELPMADLPGFVPPAVAGHGGTIRSVPVGDRRVLVLLGRTHLYEGHGVDAVAHGVRTAAAAGCRTVVLTNAAGGIREGMSVGEPVLVTDHLNLTGDAHRCTARASPTSPTCTPPACAPCARAIDPTLAEGVYAGLPGPHFETPAEIRMLRGLGADLVGMSTVLEAIAARAEGVEVFALSLVTNLAAGPVRRAARPPGGARRRARPPPRGWAGCCASWSPSS